MRFRLFYSIALAAVVLGILGCGPAGPQSVPTPPPFLGLPAPWGPSESGAFSNKVSVTKNQASTVKDRLIVRTVNMSMLVKDIPGTLKAIASLAEGVGGFVVTSSLSGEEEGQMAFVSVRVPAEQTEAVLAQFRGMAVRVVTEQTSTQDVTEEYVDLESRKKTLERTEQQLLQLMDRALTVEDVLKVQRELSNVQGQLEQSKGRMQYLERTTATSLVSVELRSATSPKALVGPGWSPLETAKGAVRSLTDFGKGLADVAIVIAIFAPVWVPILALVSWVVWRERRRLRRG